jgi:hypothetical protein
MRAMPRTGSESARLAEASLPVGSELTRRVGKWEAVMVPRTKELGTQLRRFRYEAISVVEKGQR